MKAIKFLFTLLLFHTMENREVYVESSHISSIVAGYTGTYIYIDSGAILVKESSEEVMKAIRK